MSRRPSAVDKAKDVLHRYNHERSHTNRRLNQTVEEFEAEVFDETSDVTSSSSSDITQRSSEMFTKDLDVYMQTVKNKENIIDIPNSPREEIDHEGEPDLAGDLDMTKLTELSEVVVEKSELENNIPDLKEKLADVNHDKMDVTSLPDDTSLAEDIFSQIESHYSVSRPATADLYDEDFEVLSRPSTAMSTMKPFQASEVTEDEDTITTVRSRPVTPGRAGRRPHTPRSITFLETLPANLKGDRHQDHAYPSQGSNCKSTSRPSSTRSSYQFTPKETIRTTIINEGTAFNADINAMLMQDSTASLVFKKGMSVSDARWIQSRLFMDRELNQIEKTYRNQKQVMNQHMSSIQPKHKSVTLESVQRELRRSRHRREKHGVK